MKILYAIQGTGNGHMARAREILPTLKSHFEVDILVSGKNVNLDPGFNIDYDFHGMSYKYAADGRLDVFGSLRAFKAGAFLRDLITLPVHEYDLIVNDFEPISAWAGKLRGIPVLACSHQAAYLFKESPRPTSKDVIAETAFKYYAPSDAQIGFHFRDYHSQILPAPVRQEVRRLRNSQVLNHITVYLPSFGVEELVHFFSQIEQEQWHVFTKQTDKRIQRGNVLIEPISNDAFLQSLANSKAVLCNAGFELPSESIYLKKKLMVVPIKGQYEQLCNAAALEEIGVSVIESLHRESIPQIREWLLQDNILDIPFTDSLEVVINAINSWKTSTAVEYSASS